ncbi:putative two component response regulator transcriptional regulator [Desulfosarcina variabilis str. Montpellier]
MIKAKLGADDYVAKPFSNRALLKKVNDLLLCPDPSTVIIGAAI